MKLQIMVNLIVNLCSLFVEHPGNAHGAIIAVLVIVNMLVVLTIGK